MFYRLAHILALISPQKEIFQNVSEKFILTKKKKKKKETLFSTRIERKRSKITKDMRFCFCFLSNSTKVNATKGFNV